MHVVQARANRSKKECKGECCYINDKLKWPWAKMAPIITFSLARSATFPALSQWPQKRCRTEIACVDALAWDVWQKSWLYSVYSQCWKPRTGLRELFIGSACAPTAKQHLSDNSSGEHSQWFIKLYCTTQEFVCYTHPHNTFHSTWWLLHRFELG